ncbi:hypothetical protein ACLKA7_002463 [Drosophila subpalustris]
MKLINNDNQQYEDYFVKAGVLYKIVKDAELIVVPRDMQKTIIAKAHDRGHFSIKKTKELICKEYYIQNLDDKIKKYIDCCIPCILVNRKRVGSSDGPKHSSSCAEYLKPWSTFNDEDSDDALEASA